MRALLLDVENQEVKIIDNEPSFKEWYNLLNCRLIEMPERQVGGKYFSFVCDEEGLLKDSPIVSAINPEGEIMLVGSLLIYNIDYNNEDIGVSDLTEDDIQLISRYMHKLILRDKGKSKTINAIMVEY